MTANQLVAYNLRRARERLGLTQELAAQRLEPWLGKRWSVASFSDAERSAEKGRTREFDANDLLAFARAFERPIAWFFTPPEDLEHLYAGVPTDSPRAVSRAELLEATDDSTLFDRVVLREQVATLRRAADALEEVERQRTVESDAAPGDTVGIGRNLSDEEYKKLREEHHDA
jgi:transcriptional regulator with XRE-family HTH domain